MKKTIYLLAISLSIINNQASAQSNAQSGSNIVAAEINFAKAAESFGIKHAFENNLDAMGIIASGVHLVNGLKAYSKANTENLDLLVWHPAFARTNSAGSFGFTTGPYLYYSKRGAGPSASGNYFSIWKRDRDMNFKLLFDGGVNHSTIAEGVQAMANLTIQPIPFPKSHNPKRTTPPEIFQTSEIIPYLDNEVLILRADQPIRFGKTNYPNLSEVLLYKQKRCGFDMDGEMYYCVGNLYELGKDTIRGFYVQVWHFEKTWKVVADVIQLAN